MCDLLVASAGGVVGAAVVGLGRITTAPGAIRADDAAAAEISGDLEAWAADEARRWRIDRSTKRQELASRGQSTSGAMANMLVATNELALIAAHDAQREAMRRLAAVEAREDWTHALVRKLWRRPFPTLEALDRIAPILDAWRQPVVFSDATTEVRDATRATVADTIAVVS